VCPGSMLIPKFGGGLGSKLEKLEGDVQKEK
jgi:hypothetical protein